MQTKLDALLIADERLDEQQFLGLEQQPDARSRTYRPGCTGSTRRTGTVRLGHPSVECRVAAAEAACGGTTGSGDVRESVGRTRT